MSEEGRVRYSKEGAVGHILFDRPQTRNAVTPSMYDELQQICGVESVLVGMGLPSDNVHSPNEHLHLPTWRKGIDAFIHFFNNLG